MSLRGNTVRSEIGSKVIVDLAQAFARSIQDNSRAVGLKMSEQPSGSKFKPACGFAFETKPGSGGVLLIDHKLLYWICDRFGGGSRMPYQKLVGKPLTVTEMVLVEELGRVACSDSRLTASSPGISLVGVGTLDDPCNIKTLPSAKLFTAADSEAAIVGHFAIAVQFGRNSHLSSMSFTSTSIDSETFRTSDPSTLWEIARGRVCNLHIDMLREWVHQETPQVGTLLLQLAGKHRAVEIIQHEESHELLMQEILLRFLSAEDGSPIMAKAIATQALAYLQKMGTTVLPRNTEFGPEVFAALEGTFREKAIKALAGRDANSMTDLQNHLAKPNLKVAG